MVFAGWPRISSNLSLFRSPKNPESLIDRRADPQVDCETECIDFFSQVERGWPWLFILSQLLSPRLCQDIPSGKPQLGAQMHFLCWLSDRPILTGLVQGCCLSISNPSASSKGWVPWETWSGQLGGKGVTLETVSVTYSHILRKDRKLERTISSKSLPLVLKSFSLPLHLPKCLYCTS